MNFVDRTLKCADCREDFVFTAGEQLFFHDKQFKNDPKRCKGCKGKRSTETGTGTGVRAETRTLCSECKTETTVPFKPTQGRPVLCRHCFQSRRSPSTGVAASSDIAGNIATGHINPEAIGNGAMSTGAMTAVPAESHHLAASSGA